MHLLLQTCCISDVIVKDISAFFPPSLKRKEDKLSRSAGGDEREQIARPSVVALCPRVRLSKGGNSDKCASCREVNGGIELWSGSGCQERRGANFQQQGYNGMCVPICECERTHRGSMFHLAQWIRCN